MSENISILIAEDSPTQLLQLQHTLEKARFQVSAAVNGKEALRLLEEGLRPTIVISDIMMPEMDGYELCKQLRADERFKHLPVILLTSLSDPKDVIRGLQCGANNFIAKPYEEKHLINRIQYLLSNFELRKNAMAEMGINVFFSGENFFITAERLQILDLLLSTYENAYHQNIELIKTQNEMRMLNERLEELVSQRTAELVETNKRLQLELVERRQAEEIVERLRRQNELILQAAGEGIIGQDLEGRVTFVNPAAEKMLGYAADEVIGLAGHATWHHSRPDGAAYPEEECSIMRACREGRTYRAVNEVFWKRDGACFPVEYVATPIQMDGKITGMVVIFGDITERKMLRDAEIARITADTANKAKSDFLANMSHELRTPMNSILGFAEVLQDQLFGPLNEKQQEYVNYIHGSGRHLLALINDILDLAKVEAGKMTLEASSFPLKNLLESSMNMLKEKAIKHGIAMELDLDPALAEELIEADERKLKQILFNLLSNAVKFTSEGGAVRVTARLMKDEGRGGMEEKSSFVPASKASGRPSSFEITVTDTGIGIRQEDLGRLFQSFSQLESPYAKQYEGTGLGLALTKKLIELHGGRIWVESEAGKGSSFIFTIPVRQPEQAQPDPLHNKTGRTGARAKTALIIEDDPLAASIVETALAAAGFSVAKVANGRDGVAAAQKDPPGLIVLDLMLPIMNGFETLAALRSQKRTAGTPVIVLTAMELSQEEKSKLLSQGAQTVLEKGRLDKEEFIATVRRVIG